jgi:hypothetical protein
MVGLLSLSTREWILTGRDAPKVTKQKATGKGQEEKKSSKVAEATKSVEAPVKQEEAAGGKAEAEAAGAAVDDPMEVEEEKK